MIDTVVRNLVGQHRSTRISGVVPRTTHFKQTLGRKALESWCPVKLVCCEPILYPLLPDLGVVRPSLPRNVSSLVLPQIGPSQLLEIEQAGLTVPGFVQTKAQLHSQLFPCLPRQMCDILRIFQDLRWGSYLLLMVNTLFVWTHWACNLSKFIPYCFKEVMSFNLHVARFYIIFLTIVWGGRVYQGGGGNL